MSKKSQTIKDLIEEAILPEKEQPNEVPENWVWTTVDKVTKEIKNGTTIRQNKDGIGVKVTRIESVQNNEIDLNRIGYIEEVSLVKKNDYYQTQDIVLSHINSIEHVGKTALIVEGYLPLVHGMNLLRIRLFKESVSPEYVQYYMMSYQFRKDVRERINRAVNQVSLNQKKLKEIPIPIPPLTEQYRIVEKVELLLNKIEEAKQLMEEAKETFELRRAAILEKAYRGELTVKWLKENGLQSVRKEFEIQELIIGLNQGWSPKCENYPSRDRQKWGVIKTTAIQHMEFNEEENKELPDSLEPREKHELKEGDILITRAGPRIRVGVCCMVKKVRPRLLLCDKAYRFRAKLELVIPEYLVLALNTPGILEKINAMKTGISESGVNLTQSGFSAIKLSIPSIDEQKEIVRLVENLFKNEQKVLKNYNMVEKIDDLKQSILSKAFRGELGTNYSTEESAIELLKEVLQEQMI